MSKATYKKPPLSLNYAPIMLQLKVTMPFMSKYDVCILCLNYDLYVTTTYHNRGGLGGLAPPSEDTIQ